MGQINQGTLLLFPGASFSSFEMEGWGEKAGQAWGRTSESELQHRGAWGPGHGPRSQSCPLPTLPLRQCKPSCFPAAVLSKSQLLGVLCTHSFFASNKTPMRGIVGRPQG